MALESTIPVRAMPHELVMFDDSEDSGDEAFPYKCDGFRGPLYFLPLRELTECSLCDELHTELAWCEWCRTRLREDHGLLRLQQPQRVVPGARQKTTGSWASFTLRLRVSRRDRKSSLRRSVAMHQLLCHSTSSLTWDRTFNVNTDSKGANDTSVLLCHSASSALTWEEKSL